MSQETGLAPGTVARAYRMLRDRGLLRAGVGQGTFVSDRSGPALAPRRLSGDGPAEIAGRHARAALTSRWLFEARANDGIQLMGGYGDVGKALAQGLIARIGERGIASAAAIATLHPADGAAEARNAIADRFTRLMGRHVTGEELVLSHGAHALLDMALRAMTRPGDTILTEHPTYYGALDLFEAHGLDVVPIARTPRGLDLAALEHACRTRSPRLFYFTGSPSTPCGHVLEEGEARDLLALVKKWHLPTIEDSALWPFRFDGRPLPPLYAQDDSALVIHICSLSKWFFPSLRFAVALGTSRSFARLRLVNRGVTRISSVYPQFAVADYLASSAFETDFRSSVAAYAEACDALLAGLHRHLPGRLRPEAPRGGFSVWIELPSRLAPERLYGQCMREGVYPLIGRIFTLKSEEVTGLRLAFGQNPPARLEEASRRLGTALRLVLRDGAETAPPPPEALV